MTSNIRRKGCGILQALFVLCLSVSFSLALADSHASFKSDVPRMKFDWPTTGRVRITDTATKKGRTVRLQYDLVINQVKDSQDLEIKYRNFDVLSIEGLDLNVPGVRKHLAPALALMSALPSYRIKSTGELVDLTGVEELLARMLNSNLLGENIDEQDKKKIIELFANPDVLRMMKASATSNWNHWVGMWIDYPNKEGASYSTVNESVIFGSVIPFQVTIDQLPLPKDEMKGKVKLYMVSVADEDAIIAAYKNAMGLVEKKGLRKDKPLKEDKIELAEQKVIIDIITDPDTLMPVTVVTDSQVNTQIQGEGVRQQRVRHQYDFDWSK